MPSPTKPQWDYSSPGFVKPLKADCTAVNFLEPKDEKERDGLYKRINDILTFLPKIDDGKPTLKEVHATLEYLISRAQELLDALGRIDEKTNQLIIKASRKGREEDEEEPPYHRAVLDSALSANQELLALLIDAKEIAPTPTGGRPPDKEIQDVFNNLIDLWSERNGRKPDDDDYICKTDASTKEGDNYQGNCHAFLTEVFKGKPNIKKDRLGNFIAHRIKTYSKK